MVATSTYKSLGGPPGGLIITDDSELASRIDLVVYPGLTANFDVGRIAALAVTFLDLKTYGKSYADAMLLASRTLAEALDQQGIAVFGRDHGFTGSHQFALEGEPYGGAPIAVVMLRRANLLASSIGLPFDRIGIRMGTPELVRRGMSPENTIELAELLEARFVAEIENPLLPKSRPLEGGLVAWHTPDKGVAQPSRTRL